jgi:RHS repeat-associated protein
VRVEASLGYDALGRRVFESASGESRRFEYDDLDRMVVRTDATAGSERFHYDEDGFLVQHVQPGSSWSGGDGEVVVGYGYDERGGLSMVRDPHAGDWQVEYDAIGRLIQRRDPSGGEWRALYTEEGFIDRIDISVPGTGGDYIDYSGYDDLGNPGVVTTSEGTTSVVYDSLSRVTQVSYPGSGGSEGFGYDLVGNRISHTDRSGTEHEHVVDAADQLREIKVGQTVLESFGYDGAGRRISRVVSGGETTQYGYNALGALTSVSRPGYGAALGYDAEGEVSVRSETGGTAYYPSPALESRGGHAHRILRAPGSGSVISEVERTAIGHRVHQPYRDGGGSVARVSIQEEDLDVLLESPPARYEAFGALRSGSSVLERGFAGQVREGETGLIRMGVRHYDPATGCFLQGDPLGIAASELYAYASSNPYRFWDPTGLSPVDTGLTGEVSEEDSQGGLQPGDITPAIQAGEILRGYDVRSTISKYGSEIEGAAGDYGVDANLIRAIIYEEQTHLLPLVESGLAQRLGIGRTVGLGQVTVGYYGYSRSELLDPATNIRAMGIHLSTMGYFPPINPASPISSAGTRYNCMSCTSIAPYGRRVEFYYDQFSRGIWP